MSSIRIYLDNYQDACFPGQTLSGRVVCSFDEETNLRAVRIKFKGRAETEWHESRSYRSGGKTRTRRIRYHAEELYFDAEYNLVTGDEDFHLPLGTHTYPFSYILPAQLPSSFEGAYGNIRYYIKATVDRPWRFDYEDKLHFNVASLLDLNYLPGLRNPVANSVDKTFCSCWCNDSGALTFNMSLPASGFVPGQEVNIGAYVQNMTNVTAEKVKFKIVQDIEFIAHHNFSTKSRYDELVVAGCMEAGIGAHGEKSWTSTLAIPPGSYPNMIPCNIINITYNLKGEIVVPCPHTNLDNEFPVVIGAIPLAGVSTTFTAGPPPQMPVPVGLAAEATPLLPDLSPPYPGGDTPYPAGASAPYPPADSSVGDKGGSDDFVDLKSPSAPPGETPYPSAPAPRSSSAAADASLGLPSYEEAQNVKEK